jgi:hypothetical protein
LPHSKCTDEKALEKEELFKKYTDKTTEQRLKINELVEDLRLEEEKLLNTIDALNHSNEQGDKMQKRIDELLAQFEKANEKHEASM